MYACYAMFLFLGSPVFKFKAMLKLRKTSAGSLINPASSVGLRTFKINLVYLCSVGISASDKISFS